MARSNSSDAGPRRADAAAQELYVALRARFPSFRSLLVSGVQCSGAEVVAERLVHIAHAAGQHNVSLVKEPAGAYTDNGSEGEQISSVQFGGSDSALDVPRLRGLIKEGSDNRMLVFATSDFVGCAESSAVAAAVDGVVLVVENQRTTKTGLIEVRERIANLKACVVGVVYTDRSLA